MLDNDIANLKDFIINNKDLIDGFQVKAIFDKLCNKKSSIVDTRGAFSFICNGWIKLGLNPLEKLDEVPNFYARYITASEIIVPSNIKEISFAAFKKANLDTVIIDKGVKHIASFAFSDCKINLVIIKNPNIEITDDAFMSATFKQLEIPDNVHLRLSYDTNIEKIIRSK